MKVYKIASAANVYRYSNGRREQPTIEEEWLFTCYADAMINKLFDICDEATVFAVKTHYAFGYRNYITVSGTFLFDESELKTMNLLLDDIVFGATDRAGILYAGELEFVESTAWEVRE